LLEEMRHRVANSLQIIASILLLKARAVASEDTRSHLQDAHSRVMSVAAVQQHLHTTDGIDQVEVGTYLTKLCAGLASSMVGEAQPVAITVKADAGMVPSAKAVSLGLIVTELVINALKYAFPTRREGAAIIVSYQIDADNWKLVVGDNGIGKEAEPTVSPESGLGTTIVKSLAKQLGATVAMTTAPDGFTVAISRATFTPRPASAA
jgi:chemotaxis protein methyltransferase CheR